MEKKSPMFLAFLIGAAAGAAVAYLITSGKAEELSEDLKETAGKVKDELDKQLEKGKEMVEDLKHKADEAINSINRS
jgi:uncharacterized protein YjbJ (UPF0337 family)